VNTAEFYRTLLKYNYSNCPLNLTVSKNAFLSAIKGMLLSILFIGSQSYADREGSSPVLGISGEVLSFVENIEYDNTLRTGETILGASLRTRVVYRPEQRFRFSAGFFGRRNAGDSRFLSSSRALIGAAFFTGNFTFTLGELQTPDNKEFTDILFKSDYRWNPGFFEGLELSWRTRLLSQRTWIHWYALNTPSQREHFALGNYSSITYGVYSVRLSLIADHHGGQLYAPAGDPVRENIAGTAGLELNFPFEKIISGIKGMAQVAVSADRDRSLSSGFKNGYGFTGGAAVNTRIADISLNWFKGEQFKTALGNPLYGLSSPYYILEISKSFSNSLISADGGIRFEFIGSDLGEYLKNPQHRWWLSLSCSYYSFRQKLPEDQGTKKKSMPKPFS